MFLLVGAFNYLGVNLKMKFCSPRLLLQWTISINSCTYNKIASTTVLQIN